MQYFYATLMSLSLSLIDHITYFLQIYKKNNKNQKEKHHFWGISWPTAKLRKKSPNSIYITDIVPWLTKLTIFCDW